MPVTPKHIEKIYFHFRKAQADHFSRGFRMPKDFEKHFDTKFAEQNKKALIKITGWFLTKWQNIEPYDYFRCGFELHDKNFSYMKFFHEKILMLYKTRDQNKKRKVKITKQGLVNSAKFVKKYMNDYSINSLYDYIGTSEGNQKIAVEHYLANLIDASFFVYLLNKGMKLTDHERGLVPYIGTNYRRIMIELKEMKAFVKKLEGKL